MSVGASKFYTKTSNDLLKNVLKIDLSLSKQYFVSSKEFLRETNLVKRKFESDDKEQVTASLVQQEYIQAINDNDKFSFTTRKSCLYGIICNDDTTERKRASFSPKLVKTSYLRYPANIFPLKRKKKRRNRKPQLEDPVAAADRFFGGCPFGEISVAGMCVHNVGFF